MIDVSVIVLNYKTKDLTLDCVKSVFKNTSGLTYEIILIDNASKDGSVEAFKDFEKSFKAPKGGKLKLVVSQKNTGFTGGNNLGLAQSEGEFVLFLNSDTLLTSNSIKQSVDFIKDNPDIGALSCQLQNPDGTLQGCGGSFPTLPKVFAWMFFIDDLPILKNIINPYHAPLSNFNKSHYQDWVAGTFFLTARRILEKVGSWDAEYFMYVEDVDLSYRIKKAGWKIYFLADTAVKHIGSASSSSDRSILSELKNIKLFYKKNMPNWQLPLLTFLLMLGSLARLILFRRGVYATALQTI